MLHTHHTGWYVWKFNGTMCAQHIQWRCDKRDSLPAGNPGENPPASPLPPWRARGTLPGPSGPPPFLEEAPLPPWRRLEPWRLRPSG